jgi:outer membrane biogenesis lipoprotein LolB
MTRFLLIVCVAGLFTACRSTRPIQVAIQKKDTTSVVILNPAHKDSLQVARLLLTKLDSTRIEYSSFTAKLNVDYRGGDGKKHNVNANIRMLKDSALWISANAILGIEAMRVMVTRDSVKLLDKMNNIYTARSIDYLQEVTSLPLDLSTLQELIIGNPVFVDSNVVSYSTGSNYLSFLSIGEWFKNLVTLDLNNNLLHSKLDDVNITRSRTAQLDYANFENKKGMNFSTRRRIIVVEKTRLEIDLDFKQFDFNQPVSFPFSIPKNYERK